MDNKTPARRELGVSGRRATFGLSDQKWRKKSHED